MKIIHILTDFTVTTTGKLKYFIISEVNMKMNIPSPMVHTANQKNFDLCEVALIRDGIPCMEVVSANPVTALRGLPTSTIFILIGLIIMILSLPGIIWMLTS